MAVDSRIARAGRQAINGIRPQKRPQPEWSVHGIHALQAAREPHFGEGAVFNRAGTMAPASRLGRDAHHAPGLPKRWLAGYKVKQKQSLLSLQRQSPSQQPSGPFSGLHMVVGRPQIGKRQVQSRKPIEVSQPHWLDAHSKSN